MVQINRDDRFGSFIGVSKNLKIDTLSIILETG